MLARLQWCNPRASFWSWRSHKSQEPEGNACRQRHKAALVLVEGLSGRQMHYSTPDSVIMRLTKTQLHLDQDLRTCIFLSTRALPCADLGAGKAAPPGARSQTYDGNPRYLSFGGISRLTRHLCLPCRACRHSHRDMRSLEVHVDNSCHRTSLRCSSTARRGALQLQCLATCRQNSCDLTKRRSLSTIFALHCLRFF